MAGGRDTGAISWAGSQLRDASQYWNITILAIAGNTGTVQYCSIAVLVQSLAILEHYNTAIAITATTVIL